MLKTDVTITEGTTDYIDFSLLKDADGDGVPEAGINLSAIDHIELHRKNSRGAVDSFSSVTGALSFPAGWDAAGSVRWAPGTADLQAALSPYRCQFKIFATGTRWYWVPEDSEFQIRARVKIA